MEKTNDKRRRAKRNLLWWIFFFVVTPPIVGYLFQGPRIFSSFSHYITYTSIGYAYGIAFGVGNWLISRYIGKIDWAKNPKRTNLISFFSFIGYGIFMSIMIPYTIDVFLWGMTGWDVFYDVLAKAFITIVAYLIIFYFHNSTFITNNWLKSIEKNEELKRENLLAKYETLKNQVNPHFLFNSLNTLSGVVEQNSEMASKFIRKLSDIYRYVLELNDKELVSINEEMKFVEDYVFLSKMRFGNALLFNSQIKNHSSRTAAPTPSLIKANAQLHHAPSFLKDDFQPPHAPSFETEGSLVSKIFQSADQHETYHNIQVVPLSLQMLVENAIKHNIIAEDMPLSIDMEMEDGFIIVRNNLQKKRTINGSKEPLGLENLKKRYAYLSDVSLEISESDENFTVKLPIIEP